MEVIVLAAGQGKRMRSVLPKVLQPLAAKPMLAHVLDTARALAARRIVVVYGHGGEVVREALDAPDLAWARQDPPQGTGHAVQQAMPLVDDGDVALILYGDVPLIGVPDAAAPDRQAAGDRAPGPAYRERWTTPPATAASCAMRDWPSHPHRRGKGRHAG